MQGRDLDLFYDRKPGTYDAAPVKVVRTRTIRAGDSLEVEIYPCVRMPPGYRRERAQRLSTPAQIRRNAMHAQKRIRRLLEANFTAGDYALHLTFAPGAMDYGQVNRKDIDRAMEEAGAPWDVDAVRRQLRNYFKRVRRRMRQQGRAPALGLKYLYVIETGKEARDADPHPLPPRFHVHMAIHADGLSRETLESLWPHGYANCDRLNTKYNGLDALAAYMAKQFARAARTAGDSIGRRWAHSQNLVPPMETVCDSKARSRTAERIARDPDGEGRALLERMHKGYVCAEPPTVRVSDYLPGVYIYARMRKLPPRPATRPPEPPPRAVPRPRPAAPCPAHF